MAPNELAKPAAPPVTTIDLVGEAVALLGRAPVPVAGATGLPLLAEAGLAAGEDWAGAALLAGAWDWAGALFAGAALAGADCEA